jgi:hypothetical protein
LAKVVRLTLAKNTAKTTGRKIEADLVRDFIEFGIKEV